MADVITRFKLETTQFDSKLRDAAKNIRAISNDAKATGNSLDMFSKESVDAARALGSVASGANNTKNKVRDLVGAYNDAAKAYNELSEEQQQHDFGKSLAASLETLKSRITEAKQELYGLGDAMGKSDGGGFLSGLGSKMSGALQVFGGNLLTQAAGAVANLGSEMYGMVQQGIELAKQGEGIRNAFARLGRGDILDGLRQATHGTVTDLELMKAAVKFNDFRLPLNELGTMLAFAQQKAKDTGQSVDYMVDSIVTGLGRKSLMILDNLGLSATEIREKMKETGDMTTAVGAIIREQMSKAGDYVETAADRAAQANVSLQNKMEELGRKFAPVEEASTQLWTSMKIAILDVVGGPLAKLLNGLTEAGRLRNMINDINTGGAGNQTHLDRVTGMLRHYSGDKQSLYNRQMSRYSELERGAWREANRLKTLRANPAQYIKDNDFGGRLDAKTVLDDLDRQIERAENKARAWQDIASQYSTAAKTILNPQAPSPAGITDGGGGKGGNISARTTVKELTEEEKLQQQINDLVQQGMTMDEQGRAAQRVKIADLQAQLQTYKDIENELRGIEKKEKPIEIATGTSIQNEAGMSMYIASLKKQLASTDYGSSDYSALSAELADMTTLKNLVGESMKAGLGTAMFDVADETGRDFWTRAMEGGVEDTDWQAIVDKINEKLKAMGLEPISLNFKTGDVKNQAKEMTKDWNSAASAIQSVGSAMSQIEDPAAKVMGTVAQAIATISLTFAKSLDKTFGPWDWIAAAAAGTATMISTISAIHSATGYAQGGIVDGRGGGFVGGTAYSGDNVGNVRLDSGELVLNRAQQSNLESALRENTSREPSSAPYVTGEKIFLGLNNFLMSHGMGQLVTTKSR